MASFAVQFCDLHFHRTGVGASFGSGRLTPVDIKFSLQFFHQGQQVNAKKMPALFIPVGEKDSFRCFTLQLQKANAQSEKSPQRKA